MTITFLNPSNAPKPAANYSNLAVIPVGKKLLSISGQIGNNIEGEVAESLEDQYRLALQNINLIVESQGGTKEAIAKITVFMTNEPEWEKIKSAADEFLPSPRPSMSFIYVKGLFRPEIKVEIEALAAVD
ncbi:RidA family protein [Paracoccaceae bacterium]|nr:RidA family protein [Paracoccaceae bacterium]